MKHIKFYKYIAMVFIVFVIPSCSDDFLDKAPLDAASDATFFRQASDFENFLNGLYGNVIRSTRQDQLFLQLEQNTDNIVTTEVFGGIYERSNAGIASQTNNIWNNQYTFIRSINYMLNSQDNLETRDEVADHYIGEGYFMRAFFYFNLLQNFGGVPYIDEALGTSSEDLYKPRDSREFIATKIIEDLDEAIALLQWKGQGPAVIGRINKEAALHLKTRVGLYEGTWERYHGAKSSPFAVSGNDGSTFLNAAVEAGDMLIACLLYTSPSPRDA